MKMKSSSLIMAALALSATTSIPDMDYDTPKRKSFGNIYPSTLTPKQKKKRDKAKLARKQRLRNRK